MLKNYPSIRIIPNNEIENQIDKDVAQASSIIIKLYSFFFKYISTFIKLIKIIKMFTFLICRYLNLYYNI